MSTLLYPSEMANAIRALTMDAVEVAETWACALAHKKSLNRKNEET